MMRLVLNGRSLVPALLAVVMAAGCSSVTHHQGQLHSSQERQLTLGVVQRDIRVGMQQADVAASLGSPNIVTKDASGTQTWIYDKIATETSYSNSSTSASLVGGAAGIAGTTPLGGGAAAGHSRSAGAKSTTQRTLTVVIKFDDAGLVKSVDYHTSRF